MCMGDQFAMAQLFLMLTALIQRFYFRLPEGTDLDYISCSTFGLVCAPQFFKVIACQR